MLAKWRSSTTSLLAGAGPGPGGEGPHHPAFHQHQQHQAASNTTSGAATATAATATTVKQGWILKRAGSGFLAQWRLKFVVIASITPSPSPAYNTSASGQKFKGHPGTTATTTSTVLQIFDQCDQSRPPKHELVLEECEIEMVEDAATSNPDAANTAERTGALSTDTAHLSISSAAGRRPIAPFVLYSKQRKFHFAGQTRGDSEEWLNVLIQYAKVRYPRRRLSGSPTRNGVGIQRSMTAHDIIRQQQQQQHYKPVRQHHTMQHHHGNIHFNLPNISGSVGRAQGAMISSGGHMPRPSAIAFFGGTSGQPSGGGMVSAAATPGDGIRRSNTQRSIARYMQDDDNRSIVSFDDAASVISSLAPSVLDMDNEGSCVSSGFETLSFCSEPILTPQELTIMGSSAVQVATREEILKKRRAPLSLHLERQQHQPERWNERYQRLLSQNMYDQESALRQDVQLLEIIGMFEEAAVQYAVQMIDEFHLPSSSIPGGDREASSPGAVFVDGMILHFACNYDVATPEEIDIAMVKTGAELRAIDAVNNTRCGLQTALMVLIDYKGFRVVAYADMGIDEKTTPLFDLSENPPITNEKATEKMLHAAKLLNLKAHGVQIGDDRRVNVSLGSGVEIHHDNQLKLNYAVNLHSILPMDFYEADVSTPNTSPTRQPQAGSIMSGNTMASGSMSAESSQSQRHIRPSPIRRMRPEFLKSYEASAISSDAFTPSSGCGRRERSENDLEAAKASKWLNEVWIPGFVRRLDMLEVRVIDSRSVSLEMHRNGVNMRYLGLVARLSTIPYIQELACIEMVARAAKSIFRSRLRALILHFRSVGATQIDEEMRSFAANLFCTILGNSEKSMKFFEERIRPELISKFDYDMDLSHFVTLHRPAIFLAMQYQCGVVYDDSTDYTFDNGAPCPRNRLTAFMARRKHPNGLPLPTPQANSALQTASVTNSRLNITSTVTSVSSQISSSGAAGTVMSEEGRQAYLLARHFKSQGPRGKLARSDASAMRLTEVAAYYNAIGRFEEARRHAAAGVSAADRNSCASALAKAQMIEAVGALGIPGGGTPHPLPMSQSSTVLGDAMVNQQRYIDVQSVEGRSSTGTLLPSRGTNSNGGSVQYHQQYTPPEMANLDPVIQNLFISALATVEWHWGPSSPMTMAIYDHMSSVHLRARQIEQALDYHQMSLNIAMSALGKSHPITASYLTRTGVLLLQTQQTDAAISRLNEALQIHTGLASPDIITAEVHHYLADALDAKGDLDAAIANAQRGRKLRERILGQHDARCVASYMQLAALVMKPYTGYKGVLTPAIRAAYREAISCYEKVFRFVKTATMPSTGSGMSVGGGSRRDGPWSSSASVISLTSMSTGHETVATSATSSTAFIGPIFPPVAGPSLTFPYGGPPQPLPRSILHKLTRQIVALKLALVESPRHKEIVRTLRATARAAAEHMDGENGSSGLGIGSGSGGVPGFDPAAAREVVLRMAAVSPSIYLDGVMARIDDDDASAIEELAIALQLTESELIPVEC